MRQIGDALRQKIKVLGSLVSISRSSLHFYRGRVGNAGEGCVKTAFFSLVILTVFSAILALVIVK